MSEVADQLQVALTALGRLSSYISQRWTAGCARAEQLGMFYTLLWACYWRAHEDCTHAIVALSRPEPDYVRADAALQRIPGELRTEQWHVAQRLCQPHLTDPIYDTPTIPPPADVKTGVLR